jgi:hypothetical protein
VQPVFTDERFEGVLGEHGCAVVDMLDAARR